MDGFDTSSHPIGTRWEYIDDDGQVVAYVLVRNGLEPFEDPLGGHFGNGTPTFKMLKNLDADSFWALVAAGRLLEVVRVKGGR